MVNSAKNDRINSSGHSPAQWVIGRGYKLPWSLLDEKQSGELASWSCQITRLSSVDECHSCGLHDVPAKPWTPVTARDVRCWPVFEQVATPRGL